MRTACAPLQLQHQLPKRRKALLSQGLPALFAGSLFHDKTKPVSGFLAYDGGPQVFLRAAVNTNEKRNHEICFIIVSSRRFCVSI